MSKDASICENCGGESYHHTVECYTGMTFTWKKVTVELRDVPLETIYIMMGCVCALPIREGDVLAPCPVHGWVTH